MCADQWNKLDADVACRMVGFDGSLSSLKEKKESEETNNHAWLNNIQCTGIEQSLFSCIHDGLSAHNCERRQRAGATCRPKGTKDTYEKLRSLMYLYFLFSLSILISVKSRCKVKVD